METVIVLFHCRRFGKLCVKEKAVDAIFIKNRMGVSPSAK